MRDSLSVENPARDTFAQEHLRVTSRITDCAKTSLRLRGQGRSSNYFDRALRMRRNRLRNRTEPEPGESAVAVRSDNDQICRPAFGIRQDHMLRMSGSDLSSYPKFVAL